MAHGLMRVALAAFAPTTATPLAPERALHVYAWWWGWAIMFTSKCLSICKLLCCGHAQYVG